jgi:hypothetical protein
MYWILLAMGAIVSIVAAVIVGGLLVPRRYAVTRRLTLSASPARVRAALASVAAWPLWMEQARTPAADADASTIRVLDDDGSESARIVIALQEAGGGTRVDASESGDVANPATRLLRQYVTGHAALLTAVLRTLAEQVDESNAAIEEPAPPLSTTRGA